MNDSFRKLALRVGEKILMKGSNRDHQEIINEELVELIDELDKRLKRLEPSN